MKTKRVDHALVEIAKRAAEGVQPTTQEVTDAIAATVNEIAAQYGLTHGDAKALLDFSFDLKELTEREVCGTVAMVTAIIPQGDSFGDRLATLVKVAIPPYYRDYKVWYKAQVAGLTVLGLNEVEADFVIGNAQAVAKHLGKDVTPLLDNCKKLIAGGEPIDDVMALIRKAIQIGQLGEVRRRLRG